SFSSNLLNKIPIPIHIHIYISPSDLLQHLIPLQGISIPQFFLCQLWIHSLPLLSQLPKSQIILFFAPTNNLNIQIHITYYSYKLKLKKKKKTRKFTQFSNIDLERFIDVSS
ncbi:hypothetical protein ACH5RR_015721, partial [Cinchona calisaya]